MKHAEHKRYYARTAFKYERRRWTVDEDKLVLIHRIPDSELSPIIKRSMKSISNRRWRLRKAASENKMTDQRYREILPMAYMTAAIEKGRQPRPVEVGLCARAIVDAEDENNLAYRVAMATKIHCTIVGVKRVSTKTGYDKYEITYRTFGKDEDETIPSPLIGDFRYGKVTEWLWGKKNDDGTDYWPGRRAVLYKHNDPPKEGDMSSAGYRCCVFAEALDK